MYNQARNEGDTAGFACQVTSEPISVIQWYYNGTVVTNQTNMNKYVILQSSSNTTTINNTLTIMNVQSSDVGTYTCNATNVVSSDTGSGVLTVNGKSIKYLCFISKIIILYS